MNAPCVYVRFSSLSLCPELSESSEEGRPAALFLAKTQWPAASRGSKPPDGSGAALAPLALGPHSGR